MDSYLSDVFERSCHSILAYRIQVHSFDCRTKCIYQCPSGKRLRCPSWSEFSKLLISSSSVRIIPVIICTVCVPHCTPNWASINIIIRQRTEFIVDYRHRPVDPRLFKWSQRDSQLSELCRKELDLCVVCTNGRICGSIKAHRIRGLCYRAHSHMRTNTKHTALNGSKVANAPKMHFIHKILSGTLWTPREEKTRKKYAIRADSFGLGNK